MCARCASPLQPGARFCPNCGAPQSEAPREERRVVTILFGDIAGFTEMSESRDAEEVKAILDRAFKEMAAIVVDHGGRVDKIIGDEIMAVFGAPQAHEDDPERAVRAALAMQRAVAEHSASLEASRGITLQMHVGINTGEVVAGFVGGSDAYTVMGDAVNTARRIGDAAEAGQILVGQQTHDASADAVTYRAIGEVSAKGKRLPVAVWEAVAERGLPGERGPRAAPLIGREEELALLAAMAAIVRRDRRPLCATLVGPAGIGKSRLAETFEARVRAAGVRVLDGRSLAYGSSSPAFEVQQIVRAAVRLARGDSIDVDVLKERLDLIGFAAEVDIVAAFLGLGGEIRARSGGTPGSPAGPSGDAGLALEVMRGLIAAIARAEDGLVLAFHDLQWAEDAVLDFVQALLGEDAPIFVLCLLEPLSRDRAAAMLDVLAPTLSPPVREMVLDRAGGNPFFLEELARLLADAPARSAKDISVPSSVYALVAARLDALPDAAKAMIQDAAIIGETFWPGALRAMGSPIDDVLELAEVRELIEPGEGTVGGDQAWRFRQTVVREVAYGAVPKNVRARHHAAVADWLGSVSSAGELDDLIAHHYERAATLAREIGEPDEAIEARAREFLERAGDHALAMDASGLAARFLERAVAFARDGADASTLRLRLGEALVGSWRMDEAAGVLEQVLAEAQTSGDRRSEGRALRLLGDAYRMVGRGNEARQPLERSLEIAKEIKDVAEEAAALRARGQLDLFQGQWQSSTLWFRQALARYREAGDRKGEAWSLQNLGWASMFMRRLDDARDYLLEGEAIFADLGDEEGIGWCMGMRGWVLLLMGDVAGAGEIAERIEHMVAVEHPEYLLGAGFVLELQQILRAYVETIRGRFARVREILDRALRSAEEVGADWIHALGHYPLFMSALFERRFAEAAREVELAVQGAKSLGDPLYVGLSDFAVAWLAFERGELDEAERLVAPLARDDDAGRRWRGSSGVLFLQASIAAARGDIDGAIDFLTGERGLGERGITLISPSRTGASLADLLRQRGEHDRAIEVARTAIDAADQEVVPRLVAMRSLAEALLAAGEAAEAEGVLAKAFDALDETDWAVERVRLLAVQARALDAQRRFDESAEVVDRARAVIDALPPGTEVAALEASLSV